MKEKISIQEASELRLFMIADHYTPSQIAKEMAKYEVVEMEDKELWYNKL